MSEKRVKVEREVAEREIKVERENIATVYATGVFPSGTKNITENGTYDVTTDAAVKVDIPCLLDEDVFAPVYEAGDFQKSLKRVVFHEKAASRVVISFYRCEHLEYADLSGIDTTSISTFQSSFDGCSNLKYLNISGWIRRPGGQDTYYMFRDCAKLKTLIIDSAEVFSVGSPNAFANSSFATGTGFVYVPDSLVSAYKAHDVWGQYADQIKPLSELPEEYRA